MAGAEPRPAGRPRAPGRTRRLPLTTAPGVPETLPASGDGAFLRNHRLAPFTTLGVGGAADWFVEARSEEEILGALDAANAAGLPVTILGGGSNLLVADGGVRGLVIRIRGGAARRIGPATIRAAAGMSVNGLVRWTIQRGLRGLEAWAGTPGVVGGAIHGNAHFGGRQIGAVVEALRCVDRSGRATTYPAATFELAPGGGVLRDRGLVLLSADFAVTPDDPAPLRKRARASLAYRKRTQPLGVPSAGCAFRNPDPASVPPGIPGSAGALLDGAGLKGRSIGGARVSEVHANFLVADPGTTASDVRRLMDLCRVAVSDGFGVELVPEIVFVGEFSR